MEKGGEVSKGASLFTI